MGINLNFYLKLDHFEKSIKSLRKKTAFIPQDPLLFSGTIKDNITYFENALDDIHEIIKNHSDGLYESLILDLKHKVKIFGFHFASLDIRQDSRIHKQVFDEILSHPKIRDY